MSRPGNYCPRDADSPRAKSTDELPNNGPTQRVNTNLHQDRNLVRGEETCKLPTTATAPLLPPNSDFKLESSGILVLKFFSLAKETPFEHQPGGVADSIDDGNTQERGKHHQPTPDQNR